MRPPELPGGKMDDTMNVTPCSGSGFNEAAGITRRKGRKRADSLHQLEDASMRPPELPGGKWRRGRRRPLMPPGFNEAAGITRRKEQLPLQISRKSL